MKLFYIGIVRNQDKPAVELVSEKELSSYSRFTKNSYAKLMTLVSKTVAERTQPGQRLDVEEHDLVSHAFGRSEGICGMPKTLNDGGEKTMPPIFQKPKLGAHSIKYRTVQESLLEGHGPDDGDV
ncbi:hypothetical protein CEP53_012198 [Fusarium sp. AF-6]|nr:hypothetical protein CEP53_012198 [Fusarium sp. AF-6]